MDTKVKTNIVIDLDLKKEVANHLMNKYGKFKGEFAEAIDEGLRLWLEKERGDINPTTKSEKEINLELKSIETEIKAILRRIQIRTEEIIQLINKS